MLKRDLHEVLTRFAARMPILTVMGPRQSGKTTLVRAAFPEKPYVSLELPEERSFALNDPLGLLARFPDGAVIDEVQRAPDLLSYLQVDVDRDDRPGDFPFALDLYGRSMSLPIHPSMTPADTRRVIDAVEACLS